jgi:hypothetical protein
MKYNCHFEDVKVNLNVSPCSQFRQGQYGTYFNVDILMSDVSKLMSKDIVPKHIVGNRFTLDIKINYLTQIFVNGIRVTSLDPQILALIDLEKCSIDSMGLKKYSDSTWKRRINPPQCYATHVSLSKIKG